MMEGAPQGNENIESPDRWRELKAEAPARAERLISTIGDFNEKTADEKMVELNALIEELSEDNDNRYVARELSLIAARIGEANRHAEEMMRLAA